MGILDAFFKKQKKEVYGRQWSTFTESAPAFNKYDGGVYGQELTRSVINKFAETASKLKPEVTGEAKPNIKKLVETWPNPDMTWPVFIARVATVLEAEDTAFIVPSFKPDLKTVDGLWPMVAQAVDVIEYKGEMWLRFWTATGEDLALPARECCILTKFQYTSDIFGEPPALDNTLQLISDQAQAQKYAMRNGAKVRFIGALAGVVREEEMEKKRERFVNTNLKAENEGGLMLYDATFDKVVQVDNHNYVMDSGEMERIEANVFNYYGMNERILRNDYDENIWGAYYEGKVEPFAVQLGEGLTKMLYTDREVKFGNRLTFSSNRLQYASNASKRNMIRDLLDRGVLTINQALEILQLPNIGPEGDIRIIRGEYVNASAVSAVVTSEAHDKKPYDTDGERKLYDDENPDPEEVDYAD